EVNVLDPDLVIVPGDLTANGYRDEFLEAQEYLGCIKCENVIVIAGNHDCRNVGYLHFEEIFGRRYHEAEYPFKVAEGGAVQERIKVVAADSNKPDLNDGELGRDKYGWIKQQFQDPEPFKLFALHHHLVGIPETGRERNILLDSGDVLEALSSVQVDLVLAGHRHVPYAWAVDGMLIVTSGTCATWRTRGTKPPSYNIIRVTHDDITVTMRDLAHECDVVHAFSRRHAPRES
ncbi:MAG: metallophosphoesterase, partial [Actinomycetota bacterium]|nr:metallophosphoesterase [Actinomycetota bacterium]